MGPRRRKREAAAALCAWERDVRLVWAQAQLFSISRWEWVSRTWPFNAPSARVSAENVGALGGTGLGLELRKMA